MGFTKFAILATFGECLKNRILTSRWIPSKIILRFIIWGFIGMWITAAFPLVDGGVKTLATLGLWPAQPAAFWMSTWLNIFAGFGFFFMFAHYWTDMMLVEGWIWPWELFGRPGTARWAKIVSHLHRCILGSRSHDHLHVAGRVADIVCRFPRDRTRADPVLRGKDQVVRRRPAVLSRGQAAPRREQPLLEQRRTGRQT